MRNIDYVNHQQQVVFQQKKHDNALLKGNNSNELQFDLEDKNEPILYSDIRE